MRDDSDARELLNELSATTNRARKAICPRAQILLRLWGLVYFVAFGALWADVTWRDGRNPVFGIGTLIVMSLVGLGVTTRELRRLHGISGATRRSVGALWTSWAFTGVAWLLVLGIHLDLHPGQTVDVISASAAAFAVVLVGTWLLANPDVVFRSYIGMSLVVAGLIGLQIPSGSYAMLFLWFATSFIFLVGSTTHDFASRGIPDARHRG